MNGKGLTVHAGLLPVLTFMEKLSFRQRIQEAVRKERGANARCQFVDAVQIVVIGLMAEATSMVQVMKACADEVVMKMAGWREIPADTTIGRIIMKMVTRNNIVELTGAIHRFRGKVWKCAVRSGQKLRSALRDIWIDGTSSVDGVYGNQEGAEVGYNPRKKGQESYHSLMAFIARTKDVLHSWFRCGSALLVWKEGYTETWVEECKSQMNGGHLRTGEFLANEALFQCAVLAYNLLKWMALLTGGVIQAGSKDDETVVDPCRWEIDKRKHTVDIKATGKVSPSGRMAGVGRNVAERRVRVKSDSCF